MSAGATVGGLHGCFLRRLEGRIGAAFRLACGGGCGLDAFAQAGDRLVRRSGARRCGCAFGLRDARIEIGEPARRLLGCGNARGEFGDCARIGSGRLRAVCEVAQLLFQPREALRIVAPESTEPQREQRGENCESRNACSHHPPVHPAETPPPFVRRRLVDGGCGGGRLGRYRGLFGGGAFGSRINRFACRGRVGCDFRRLHVDGGRRTPALVRWLGPLFVCHDTPPATPEHPRLLRRAASGNFTDR